MTNQTMHEAAHNRLNERRRDSTQNIRPDARAVVAGNLFRNVLFVGTAGLILAACNPSNTGTTRADAGSDTTQAAQASGNDAYEPNQSAQRASNLVPAEYVGQAASGDMYEIQSSELALKTSQNAEVRNFAQQMVTGHQQTTAQLRSSIDGTGLVLPTQMQPRHAQMMNTLQSASRNDTEFDRIYLEQQKRAHGEAIDLHRSMANRADLPGQLSTFARETLTKVEGHNAMLRDMPGASASRTPAATG